LSQVRFIQSASHFDQFPFHTLPQIAIAGRSNSGKSSFINTLANQKIAKVSSTPGKTRLLNIFDVEKKFWLIDMPGYGFAAISRSERRQWETMIEDYLLRSANLKGLIILMDVRRKWSDDENLLLDFCSAQNLQVVVGLTKGDKLSRSKWNAAVLKLEKQIGVPCYACSSLKRWGISNIIGHVLNNWLK
jgi:GTP-binding protein